ncbi:Hypothetical protein A7982_10222 [Minicystis rosea]|nr:Hypothetical protein A7982_10222 [Minicystis rosea]
MSQWKKIASFAALFASTALATTGCVETSDADDQTSDDVVSAEMAGKPEQSDKKADKGDEKTGQADQRCCDADEDFAIRLFIHPWFACFGGVSPCGCWGGWGGWGAWGGGSWGGGGWSGGGDG